MTFPSSLETLQTGINPTDKVSVKNHAGLHNDVDRVVNALQAKVGVNFSSDVNSLDYMIRHITGGTGSNVIRVSPPQNHVIGNVATFVHNLGFTQADIESGRYQIKFVYKVTATPANGIDSAGVGALSGASTVQQYIWDAADPIAPFNIHMQADSLKVLSSSRADDLESVRCIIIDNNIVGGGILPPWTTTYSTSFLVEDSLGNAITDAVITFNGVTNNAGDYTFDTLLGNFSYSCGRPGYITATGDVLIDGVSTNTIVLTATGAGMYNLTFDISSDVLGPLTDAIVTLNGVTYPVGQMVFNMPDNTYNYTVNRLGHDPVMGSVVVAGADVTEVVAMTALPPLYTATFYVEDNVGTPILDARIEFEGNTYPASYYDFITNAGTYNYTVHRRGYNSVSGTLVLSGNTTITIVMDPNAALHAVDFTVEDTIGMPVAGASINLNGVQFLAGQYSFNLPAGTYTYIVSKTGYYSAGSFVVVAGPTIENVVLTPITAPSTYQCTFNLSTPSGASISNFCMKVGGTLYPLDQTVITGLAPGTHFYRVKNAADNETYGSGTITIVAGDIVEDVTLNVDLYISPGSPNPVISGVQLTLTAMVIGSIMQYTWTYGATVITGDDFIDRFPTTNEDRTLVIDILGGLILETSYNVVVTPTYQATFTMTDINANRVLSGYVIKLDGIYYPLNQDVFTGLVDGIYPYEVTESTHTVTYASGNITIAGANIVKSVTISGISATITGAVASPFNNGTGSVLTAVPVGVASSYAWDGGGTGSTKLYTPTTTIYPYCAVTFSTGIVIRAGTRLKESVLYTISSTTNVIYFMDAAWTKCFRLVSGSQSGTWTLYSDRIEFSPNQTACTFYVYMMGDPYV